MLGKKLSIQGRKLKLQQCLVYITNKEDVLIGGALLNKKFALSLAWHLRNFIRDEELQSGELFIGIGVTFFRMDDIDHQHQVIKVIDDKQDTEKELNLAIVTVSSYTRT